jgi:hypothetical protein|tara:strand:- start:362 stop:616 length:255 start_codon:yes stop_codon:yes gene_type:complete
MNDEERSQHIKSAIEAKLKELSEYCDSVQILASWNGMDEPENTQSSFQGFGNWYARAGMVNRFAQEETAKIQNQLWDESDDCAE